MTGVLVVLAVYVAAVLAVGVIANRRAGGTPEDYFLAGRRLGALVLFMALFGTNATAFVLVGIPGRAYHDGIGVFSVNAPIVALFTPFTFFLIGVPARRMAARLRAVTPAELYSRRFGNAWVGALLFVFFTIYTVPYMVTAVKGASVVLADVTDGAIAPWLGGLGVVVIALVYTSLGGMRATAWTNVLQGFIFLGFLVAAFLLIAADLGGLGAATARVADHDPSLLALDRTKELYRPGGWISWGLTISLTVIAFPHMFVRLMAAGSERAMKIVCRLYPIALIALWLPPVLIGVWGATIYPGLEGKASDRIFSTMVEGHVPAALAGVGFLAVIAAVMSTLDAQLLTLSSMLVRDGLDRVRSRPADARADVRAGRLFAVAIAAAVYTLASLWGDSVFAIAKVSFSGYVTLTPVLFLGVRWRRFTAAGAIASMLVGNAVLWYLWPGPDLELAPIVWALAAAIVAGVGVSLMRPAPDATTLERAFG